MISAHSNRNAKVREIHHVGIITALPPSSASQMKKVVYLQTIVANTLPFVSSIRIDKINAWEVFIYSVGQFMNR